MSDYKNGDTASWDASRVRRSQAAGGGSAGGQHRPPQKRRRKRRHINPVLYLLCVLVVSAILAGTGWLLASDLLAFSREIPSSQEITVEITADDDMGSIAQKLQDAGLIKYKWFFRLFAGVTGAEEDIGIGTYTLNTDMDYHALISGMHSSLRQSDGGDGGRDHPRGLHRPPDHRAAGGEGRQHGGGPDGGRQDRRFRLRLHRRRLRGHHPAGGLSSSRTPTSSTWATTPRTPWTGCCGTSRRRWTRTGWPRWRPPATHLQEIITIASLIEEETDGTDQANIASVIYNRLEGPGDRQGTYGLLQIDASLLYALPDHEGAITSADMQVDSPYNLYQHAGLPPTPISNPGLASIDAALNPNTRITTTTPWAPTASTTSPPPWRSTTPS